MDSFKSYGRDIETLFSKIKIAHSKRVFCLDASLRKKLTVKDMDKGLDIYLKNQSESEKEKILKKEKKKEEQERFKSIVSSMYI